MNGAFFFFQETHFVTDPTGGDVALLDVNLSLEKKNTDQ